MSGRHTIDGLAVITGASSGIGLEIASVLQPGATDTPCFERAGMLDTRVGASEHKADPADVATEAVEAMLEGKDHIVPGWKNKLQMAMAQVAPEQLKAEMVRRQSEPGSARPRD